MRELQPIEAASRSITEGRAMFLVGAGFSIDSEGLTTKRLMGRLLLRFEGLVEMWRRKSGNSQAQDIVEFEKALVDMFWLAGKTKFITRPDNIDKLSANYYQANSWFCSAFGDLLYQLNLLYANDLTSLTSTLHTYEEHLRQHYLPADCVSFKPIENFLFTWAGTLMQNQQSWCLPKLGKVLFLDTQGFADHRLMAGLPADPLLRKAKGSFRIAGTGKGSRIRARHQVLARWAREGYLSTIQTTNFDQLIEGAFRLAGMPKVNVTDSEVMARISHYCSISHASDFFKEGGAARRARVIKFHGCAGDYRHLRNDPSLSCDDQKKQALLDYADGLVFTFRDILHWRDDGWARDLLRSELRTKMAILVGFSARDPVIFDTFRACYQEVERKGSNGSEVPFLYCKQRDQQEFAARELIDSAERAVGLARTPFGRRGESYLPYARVGSGEFPDYDQLFKILNHLTYRQRQLDLLKSHLELAADSIKDSRNEIDLKPESNRLLTKFSDLIEKEKLWFEACLNGSITFSNEVFEREIVDWTYHFHPALLREWAVHYQRGSTGSARQIPALNLRHTLYYPLEDEPLWTIGGVITELALRQIVARHLVGDEKEGLKVNGKRLVLVASHLPEPTLHYSEPTNNRHRSRRELRLSWELTGAISLNRLHLAPPHSSKVWHRMRAINGSVNAIPKGYSPTTLEMWKYAAMNWADNSKSTKKRISGISNYIV